MTRPPARSSPAGPTRPAGRSRSTCSPACPAVPRAGHTAAHCAQACPASSSPARPQAAPGCPSGCCPPRSASYGPATPTPQTAVFLAVTACETKVKAVLGLDAAARGRRLMSYCRRRSCRSATGRSLRQDRELWARLEACSRHAEQGRASRGAGDAPAGRRRTWPPRPRCPPGWIPRLGPARRRRNRAARPGHRPARRAAAGAAGTGRRPGGPSFPATRLSSRPWVLAASRV